MPNNAIHGMAVFDVAQIPGVSYVSKFNFFLDFVIHERFVPFSDFLLCTRAESILVILVCAYQSFIVSSVD